MKFSEMTYKRPDFETVKTEIRAKLDVFKNAKNAEEQIRCLDEINAVADFLAVREVIIRAVGKMHRDEVGNVLVCKFVRISYL